MGCTSLFAVRSGRGCAASSEFLTVVTPMTVASRADLLPLHRIAEWTTVAHTTSHTPPRSTAPLRYERHLVSAAGLGPFAAAIATHVQGLGLTTSLGLHGRDGPRSSGFKLRTRKKPSEPRTGSRSCGPTIASAKHSVRNEST